MTVQKNPGFPCEDLTRLWFTFEKIMFPTDELYPQGKEVVSTGRDLHVFLIPSLSLCKSSPVAVFMLRLEGQSRD